MNNEKIRTLNDFVDHIAKFNSNIAYKYIKDDVIHELTYKKLTDRIKGISSFLIQNGYKGRHIAILGATSCEWIETYLGIVSSGNVAVPLDRMLPAEEICNLLKMGDVKTLFFSEEYSEYISTYCENSPEIEEFICFSEKEFIDIIKTPHVPPAENTPETLAELIFTSGTTGTSKGVMLSHGNIANNARGTDQYGFNDDERKIALSVLPIHHTFELTVNNLAILNVGACIAINDKLENIIKNMQLFKPTHMLVVPMMAELFYKKIQENLNDSSTKKKFNAGLKICNAAHKIGVNPERKIFSQIHQKFGGQLKCLVVGGAPLRDEVTSTLEQIGLHVYQGYGLTENAPVVSVNSEKLGNRIGSVGKLMPDTKIRIQEGEIQVSGPSVMLGYYKNPDATSEVITEDGWLMTGDLGYVDDEGFIFITGRKKNLIILDNGKNIYPEELEEHIYTFEGVKDAMVYARNGKICVQIQLVSGADKSEIAKQIKELNSKMPTYKKISGVSFRNKDFPKTTTLKIKRSEVMKEIESKNEKKTPYIAPRNETEKIVCDIFEQMLNKTPYGIADDFFENGGDSLTALEAAAKLGIQAQEIYDFTTPEKLAENMDKNSTEHDERVKNINEIIENSISEKTAKPKHILLTGATGYLGSHILRELCKNKVYVTCLVRDSQKLKAVLKYYFPKEYHTFKYDVKEGNIESENLGLDNRSWNELKESIDTVIHTAANVHHTGHYEDFERTNVKGTENVIKFCKESGAFLHHTSTASVSGAGTVKQQNPSAVFTEKILDIGQIYEQNVYIHSKYKAEEKVLLARKEGLNVNIYRIGNLTWRFSDGLFQKNSDDNGFVSRCRGLVKVGVYCKELDVFPIDFTPVDLCADAYVRLVLSGDTNQIYHMLNPNMYYIRNMHKKLRCSLVSKDTFEKKILEKMPDKDVAVLSFYSMIASASDNIQIKSDITEKKLKELGFKWPKIRIGYLKYMIKI